VGVDHTNVLGKTLAEIARDKAGIARRERPFILAAAGSARESLINEAERRGAHPLILGRDGRYRIQELRVESSRFSFVSDAFNASRLELGIAGRHQVRNAACALLALGTLKSFPASPGVRPGLARLRWPGRLERLAPWLIVDGAHNALGARALAEHLGKFYGDRRVVALVGMAGARRPFAFARALKSGIAGVVLTEPPSKRAVPAPVLAGEFRRAGLRGWVEPGVKEALERARSAAGSGGLVVGCGSLYLVGAVLRLLRRRPAEVI
jgi:dihydrofolate synthase/folylpolyglutamate synthase